MVSMTRSWTSPEAQRREAHVADELRPLSPAALDHRIWEWIEENRAIHEDDCISLDPAANVMNPNAERALAAGLSSRPSLGWPGAKYETGLEAIEAIEVAAMELACRVFGANYAEIRVPSGAIGNLYCFMATCAPGDHIVVPPPTIAGHVTHHDRGAAGLYGLQVHSAPIDATKYTVDVDALAEMVAEVRPSLVTVGGSLNLFPHPVAEVAEIAHSYGAKVLYDAAHVSGLLAGGVWPNPLDLGADLLSFSTYKSLGGPAGGLVLTNDAALAERIDAIAHPGLTANFDAGVTAALALSLLDWVEFGPAYAQAFVANGIALAAALEAEGIPVFHTSLGATSSHQLAVIADEYGGGDAAAKRLRQANLLASAIGLPTASGLRLGTSEPTRWGMTPDTMVELARLIARALREDPTTVAPDVRALKQRHHTLHYIRT
jgi:glycine hydroxymethyltransferase